MLQSGICCFPAKTITESTDLYNCYIGLVIDIELHKNYQRIVSDFITTLNIFRSEYIAIHWLSRLNYKDLVMSTDLSLSNYILPFQLDSDSKLHSEQLDKLQVHSVVSNSITFSFVEVFNAMIKLDKNDFVHNSIQYLAITNPIIMTFNRVYDNALFENALIFQLFEAIMVNHEKRFNDETKICSKCKKETRIGLKSRIDRFLKDLEITDSLIIKAVKVIAGTRHKFLHSLSGLPLLDHSDQAFSKMEDNYLSFNDELKHAEGTFLGKGVLKIIITTYLIERLLSENAKMKINS